MREALAGQPEGWPLLDWLQVRRRSAAPLSRRTVGNGPGPGGRGFERRRRLQTHGASCSHWGLESRPTRRRDPMRLTTVLLGVTRALAAVKARCSAPPPLRGADGLDAGSAHARPGSCLTMTNSPTPESEATSRPEITVRRGAFPISRSRAHTHRRHGHPLQTVPSAGLIERPQEKNRVDALR